MNRDPASLENLKPLYEPPPVTWYPPAAGWWILGGLAIVACLIAGWLAWRRWKANAYRRAGLRALQGCVHCAEVADVLKRTALCTYPRAKIAALSGETWCQWMATTAGQSPSANVRHALTLGVYSGAKVDQHQFEELTDYAATWIRTHRSGRDTQAVEGGR